VNSQKIARDALRDKPSDVLAWLKTRNVDVVGAKTEAVLRDLYYESTWLGYCVARHQLKDYEKAAVGSVDWDGWVPGDPTTARLLLQGENTPGLRGLLSKANITIKGINETRLSELSTVLREAIDAGSSIATTAKAIQERVRNNSAWAEVVARTETRRAVTTSSIDYYRNADVQMKEWLTSGSAVDECKEFQDMGPIPLDADWDGNDGPPAHPNCLCVVLPVIQKGAVTTINKAGRNVIDDALERLAGMPDIKPGYLEVPWPVAERPKLMDTDWEESVIEAVEIDGLFASQDMIRRERVEFYIKNPGAIEEGRRAYANVYGKLVGDERDLVIVDGHHRLAALWLLGADMANVWYLEEGN